LPDLTCTDLENVIVEKLPLIDHNSEVAEHVSKTAIRIRMPFRPEYMGQDIWQDSGHGVFSGPKVMGLADTSMYVCMHAALGKDVVAVLSNLVITFLRPALAKDLIAEAKIIRIGPRHVQLRVPLRSRDALIKSPGPSAGTYPNVDGGHDATTNLPRRERLR
jgi:acyl-coenzyme A thioesterase PaaI-like protein